jgi:hypothetical protein
MRYRLSSPLASRAAPLRALVGRLFGRGAGGRAAGLRVLPPLVRPFAATVERVASLRVSELRKPVWPGWEYAEAFVPESMAVGGAFGALPPPAYAPAAGERLVGGRLDRALFELVARHAAHEPLFDDAPVGGAVP